MKDDYFADYLNDEPLKPGEEKSIVLIAALCLFSALGGIFAFFSLCWGILRYILKKIF